MLVCICKGLNAEDIKQSIGRRNFNIESVGADCGAGTDCGACRKKIQKMIAEEKSKLLMDLIERADYGK